MTWSYVDINNKDMESHPKTGVFLRATYEGKMNTVIELLNQGVPIDSSNQTGLQAIHFACKTCNVELVEELLSRKANVNAATHKGNTPLHVAALMGHADIVKLLLRHNACVNNQSDCFGELYSPLYMAAQIGNQEIVMLLLARGADPTLTTTNGCTAADVAEQQGHKAVSELIREYDRRTRDNADVAGAEGGAVGGANGVAPPSHHRRLIITPPMCQDVTASPRNSPKRAPRNSRNGGGTDSNN